MRYFFFETLETMRDGKMKPTLRALPGQTFDDGTPVSTELNVRAPKEKGSSINGSRLDYPMGTNFASTMLTLVTLPSGTEYYTVYDETANNSLHPDFHPVSDDPQFQYVQPTHKSDKMNAAFTAFKVFGTQTDGDDETEATASATPTNTAKRYRKPYDKKGNAVDSYPDWVPAYEDQVPMECDMIASWMLTLLGGRGIKQYAKRPKASPVTIQLINALYEKGENIDTIASSERFDTLMSDEKMDLKSLQVISQGPLEWYLEVIYNEHKKHAKCTAPDTFNPDDTAYLIGQAYNKQTGVFMTWDDKTTADLKEAMKKGWTADDIIDPSVLSTGQDPESLLRDLVSGAIALPDKGGDSDGTSYIDTLMKKPGNARPANKDGFHVDETTWKLLILNLNRKKNTLIVGPTGSGKTVLVQTLCERTGTPFTIIPMGNITEPTEQLVGKMDIASNPNSNKMETQFDWADFALAIQRPGVVLLDEINRIPRNGYNILFSVLDGTRTLVAYGAKSSDKRTIQVHPDCVFFATANIGGEYTATEDIDAALDNRFRRIEVDYLNVTNEQKILSVRTGIKAEDAKNIALVAKNIRTKYAEGNGELSHAVSTRETLDCAEYVRDGFSLEEAMEIAFLPHFEKGVSDNDPDSERGRVKAIIASLFNQ